MTDFATIGVTADTTGVQSGQEDLRRFRDESGQTERGVNRNMQSIGAAFKRLAVAAGAFVSIRQGIRSVREGLQRLDNVAKQARSLDATADGLRALQIAAEDAGVSAAEVTSAAQRMNRELARAARGVGQGADALDRLGLSAAELSAMDVDTRMAAIADRVNELGLSAGETSDLMRDLGVRSREMALLLVQGGDSVRAAREEMERLGLAVSQEDLQRIEDANDAMSRIGMVMEGFSNTITVMVAPALQRMAQAFTAAAGEGELLREVADRIGAVFVLIVNSVTAAINGFNALQNSVGALEVALMGVVAALALVRIGMLRTGIGAIIVLAGEAIYQFDKWSDTIGGVGTVVEAFGALFNAIMEGIVESASAVPHLLQATWSAIRADFGSMVAGLQQIWADFLHGLSRELRLLNVPGLGNIADDIGAEVHGAAVRAQSAVHETRLTVEEASSAMGASFEEAGERLSGGMERMGEAGEEFRRVMAAGADEIERTADAGRVLRQALTGVDGRPLVEAEQAASGLTESLEEVSSAAGSASEANERAAESAFDAWQRAGTAIDNYVDRARNIGAQMDDALVSAFRGVEDAVARMVTEGKVNFRDLANSVIADMVRIAIRSTILAPIANLLGGGGGGAFPTFGISGSPFPIPAPVAHSGGVVGSSMMPTRDVDPDVFSNALRYHSGGIAGLGPREVPIIAEEGERIIPRGQSGRSEPQVIVNIQTTDANSFRASRSQVREDIARAVKMGGRR